MRTCSIELGPGTYGSELALLLPNRSSSMLSTFTCIQHERQLVGCKHCQRPKRQLHTQHCTCSC